MYLVSVIVPVYNKKQYLKQCLDSILAQTYRNIEIILVDDGSTDGSGEICDLYAKEHEQIRVIHKENGGPTSALITGTAEAKGQYLACVDSDDWVDADMTEKLLREVTGSEKEIISSGYIIEKASGSEKNGHGIKPGVYEGDDLYRKIKCNIAGNVNRIMIMSRCMKLFSAGLIKDNLKYFDKRLLMGDDINIVLPAILSSERIVIVEEAYYHYRYVASSVVHKYNAGLYKNIRLLYRFIEKALGDFAIPNAEGMAAGEYLYLLFLVFKNEMRGNGKHCVRAIRRICAQTENHRLIQTYRLKPTALDDRLMYFMMRHPAAPFIQAVRFLLYLNDRRS